MMIDEGYKDTWKLLRTNKYDKSAPTKLRNHGNFTRIDYIWMNNALVSSYADSYLVKDAFTDYASDHYPMVLILNR
jgi:exonuclease III